jgi:hypothetical protein
MNWIEIARKAMAKIKKAYEKDRDHLVRLDEDFHVGRLVRSFHYAGKDLPVLDFECEHFRIRDAELTLFADRAGERPVSDGATLAPDKLAGVDLAAGYLPHDFLYTHLEDMARDEAWAAAGWTKESLRAFFDAILGNMIEWKERKAGKEPWRSRLYHGAVRAFGGIAHRTGIACLALFLAGCAIPSVIEPGGEEPKYTVEKRSDGRMVESSDGRMVESGPSDHTTIGPSDQPDQPDQPELDFRYGGFKGGKAKEEPGCRIGSLKVGKDKLSYKWEAGGCEALGAKDKADYSKTVACAFYWDGSRWVGGKFDWISTSRTSRGFENIKSGYNGWDSAAFFGAKKHGFCIVSKDGKKRSNFIEE